MSPEARLEEAEDWLVRARQDVRAAQVDLDAIPPLLADAAFHCQQAIEKAFKALLACHDQPLPRTHDLRELGRACLRHDRSLEELVRRSAPLSEYAWRFRYPGEIVEPEREDVDDALEIVSSVVQVVEDAVAAGC